MNVRFHSSLWADFMSKLVLMINAAQNYQFYQIEEKFIAPKIERELCSVSLRSESTRSNKQHVKRKFQRKNQTTLFWNTGEILQGTRIPRPEFDLRPLFSKPLACGSHLPFPHSRLSKRDQTLGSLYKLSSCWIESFWKDLTLYFYI